MDVNTTGRTTAILSVARHGDDQPRDLEVPTDIPAADLVSMIAHALKWDVDPCAQPLTYRIEVEATGQVLKPDETLADADAWDGANLVFYPLQVAAASAPATGPLTGWRPLGVAQSGGFVWRKVDEE